MDEGIVQISNAVNDLFIGQWIGITIWSANFSGEFLLDRSNSDGYDERDDDPDPRYCAAKYFPLRSNPNEGELVIMARFGVLVNYHSRQYEIESYDIEFKHVVDEFDLIKQSDKYYEGRSFILELQASLRGWIVLKVHEDPKRQLSCDALENALVDFNTQFLDDCLVKLPKIMTGDGYIHPPPNYTPRQNSREHVVASGSLGQNQPSTSASSYNGPSESSVQNLETRRPSTSASSVTQTPAESHPNPPPQKTAQDELDEDLDDDDTDATYGTAHIPPKRFIKEIAGKTYQRCQAEKTSNEANTESALCTVVQMFDGIAILYTAKRDVINVLLYERKCEGIEEPLQLGQIAFFEIAPRRRETQDDLLPRALYSHIAVKMKPITEVSQKKIDHFRHNVRCFGGLIEMKVKIQLTKRNNVEIYNNEDESIRHDDADRRFYLLRAMNGVRVSIPIDRLISLLDRDFTAKFDLVAWVSHRKPVGNVTLHIGKCGEAFQKYPDGSLRELAPLSTNSSWMYGKK